ncbi:MAG: M48 family metallopeptidase [Erysipelotrichaceae bacterium]|nr:M48 family metallopeptidase [Erysipelotrichaceae bacterium]
MQVNNNIFIHDSDRAALQTLKAIPGFSQVVKVFLKVWDEKMMYINNMTTNVRISDKQLKKYHDMLPPICEKLGIQVPDLFLHLDTVPKSWTAGDTKPFIVITSGLLETIPEHLLPTVLARECGHIACHHELYTTMGTLILNGTLNYILPGEIAKYAVYPIKTAFAYWMRCSEYSADRAAILCDGTDEKIKEICARFAGFDKDIIADINMEEFLNQAHEYKDLIDDSIVNKGMEFLSFGFADHPNNALRAYEADQWMKSEDYARAKKYFDACITNQKHDEFPISFDEGDLEGEQYYEVEKQLRDNGFENIDMRRVLDKSFTSSGTVLNVKINGSDEFEVGQWFSKDAKVEVIYYLPRSEGEIL